MNTRARATQPAPEARDQEHLRGQLAVANRRVSAAEAETRSNESERVRLLDQIVTLEADRRTLRQEAEHWRHCCLKVEKECANLALREDVAQGELRDAHVRERDLAVKSIEKRIAATEAENIQARSSAEAMGYAFEVDRLSKALNAKEAEVRSLRAELQETRVLRDASDTALKRLEDQHVHVTTHRDLDLQALRDTHRRASSLESQVESLHEALRAAAAKEADLASEAAAHHSRCVRLEEANKRLRLDLQEAISQAVRNGEIPFYAGGPARADVPAYVQEPSSPCSSPKYDRATLTKNAITRHVPLDNTWPRSGASGVSPPRAQQPEPGSLSGTAHLRSPKSRFDYQRSSHARSLRSQVLSARAEALDKVDFLNKAHPL